MQIESGMAMTVVAIVAVMFAATSIERMAEAWQELMSTLKGLAGDAEEA